jgi:hypothetical protein
VIKQETAGTTFVVSNGPMSWLLEYCDRHTQVDGRDIGAGEHTILADLRDAVPQTEPTATPSGDQMSGLQPF